jgi:putative ABC transport system ATP-binding protein
MTRSRDNDATIVRVSRLTKQVAVSDGELTILDDVSFEVAAGEAVAIVGVSGSGKSTLLGLLAGLDTPTSGDVRIDGRSLYALDEDGRAALRARLVGFVFQSFQLLPAMTALENVMLPLELAGDIEALDAAVAILERVGLRDRLHHYPKQLSGGEQQRVAIARAFVRSPALLLADEPTGNLDAATGEQVIDLMFALNREKRTTLVLVTHDESLSRRCERVLRLSGGRLVNGHSA